VGQLVKTLAFKRGQGRLFWNGKNRRGEKIPAGIYFGQLTVQGKTLKTHKLFVLK